LKGTTAGVVIGDRALEQRSKSKYIYDLGEAWKEHTGLPFVFAAWISNKKLPDEFINAFDEANAIGLNKINEVIKENNFIHYDLEKYYTRCVSYALDDEKRKGLELFLKKLRDLNKE
jgi:chorismate dehydratase